MRSVSLWWDKLFLFLGLMKGGQSCSPAYILSETVYRDLVQREFKRSERSGHRCRILLIYWTNTQGIVMPLGSELAGRMMAILSVSIRDTDYIGWYRQSRIVGVLLTALRSDSAGDGCDSLKTRLLDSLHRVSAVTDYAFLQIRVLDPGELPASDAPDHPIPSSDSKHSFL